jgi:hypothetical protein
MALPEYELYAIRYAMRDAQRRDHFIGGDPHDASMPMDYFVWVERNARLSSISASPRRSRRSAGALFSVARSRRWG